MFVSFLYPFRIRDIAAPYLWVFYKQMSHFKNDEILYVASEDYFVDPLTYEDRWELKESSQLSLGYGIPASKNLDAIHKFIIETSLFSSLYDSHKTTNDIWKLLITESYEKLEIKLEECIENVLKNDSIDAIITWCNCKSLENIAVKYGIKIIHNELGPTRSPGFINTAYFDFSGVNGNTESESRYATFVNEISGRKNTLLSKKEILYTLIQQDYMPYVLLGEVIPEFEIGLALQIEDDSNIIAYSNGFDSYKLIDSVTSVFDSDEVLIRKHPRGHLEYDDVKVCIDDSNNSLQFISRCNSIATINSSVALESLLLDKPTYVLGDSPLAFICNNDIKTKDIKNEEEVTALNFIVFCYLIPYELLFDINYYRMRLSNNSEIELYDYHINYYITQQLTKTGEKITNIVATDLFNLIETKFKRFYNDTVSENNKKICDLNAIANNYKTNIDNLNDIINQNNITINSYADMAQQYTIKIEMLSSEIESAGAQISEMEQEIDRLKNIINNMKSTFIWKASSTISNVLKK